jgi:hypothetical protein
VRVFVFALPFEAAGFRPCDGEACVWVAGVAGVGAARIFEERLATSQQPAMVISAGLAGALVSELTVGDIVVGEGSDERFLREISGGAGTAWTAGKIHTLDSIAATGKEKADLGKRTGAAVCDMESARLSGICRREGIPFAAVRAVSDTVTFDMPVPPGYLAHPKTGKPDVFRLCGTLLACPTRIPPFVQMIRDASRARGRLHHFLFALK